MTIVLPGQTRALPDPAAASGFYDRALRLLPVLVAALPGLMIGCSPSLPLPQDPVFLRVDATAPSHDFGRAGSLFLGDGWGRPEGDGTPGEWGGMSWVVGREAMIHVPTIAGRQVDLFARVLPFPWASGSPTQEMELVAGGRMVTRVSLPRYWRDLRLPLPDGFATGRLEEVRLKFSHALRPADVGQGPDTRALAAGFTMLAIVPRSVGEPARFLEASSFDAATGRATVPVDGGVSVALPASSRVRLRLAGTRSTCRTCIVNVELSSPSSGARRLWSGSVEASQRLDLAFGTGRSGPSRLLLGVKATARPQQASVVELALGGNAVMARRASARRGPPNVFVYMVDTLRADALAPYGGDPSVAPRMSGFAAEAATYVRSRATSTWTLPSVVSLLTGQYADRHGVMKGDVVLDPQKHPTVQARLAARGYRTLAISHSPIVSRMYGLDAGFHTFFLSNYLNAPQLRSEEASRLLAALLQQKNDLSPVFAYVHTVDPHAPYTPPAPARLGGRENWLPLSEYHPRVFVANGHHRDQRRVAQMRALYLAGVSYADLVFGRFVDLLKWLNLYENSFVILVGDHGEEFAEHGGFEHGRTLYEEALRVPFMIKFPRSRWAGTHVEDPVSLIDIAPTVLSAAGALEDGDDLDGEVLAPGPGRRERTRGAILFEVAPAQDSRHRDQAVDMRGVVFDQLKCIENLGDADRFGRTAPRLSAFDLAADPLEQSAVSTPAKHTAECRRLLDWWSSTRERDEDRQSRRAAPPETLDQLRALGYLN